MDLQGILNDLLTSVSQGALTLLAGLGILFVSWLAALILAALVRAGLRRTTLDERLAEAISGPDAETRIDLEKWIARIVFYVVLLIGVVGFFNAIELPAVSGPLQSLLNDIAGFVPGLVGALAILLVAWVIARVVRFLIMAIANRTKLDERLAAQADLDETDQLSLSNSLATAAYWLVFLFFLPAILAQLGMQGLVAPVQNMVDTMLQSIPNAFAAGLVLLIGWFIARILRQVTSNLLMVIGLDRFGERVGLSDQQSLSKLAGTVVYAFILITSIIAALDRLNLTGISAPATQMLSTALEAIPAILGATVLLVLAYMIARVVAGLLAGILTGIGFNRLPELLGFKMEVDEGQRTPADVLAYLVVVAVMLFAATEAANLLGFTLLAEMIVNFTAFGGQVLLALIIFAIGLYLANLTRNVIVSTGGQQATFTANLARIAILVFAGAMALRQMGIADEIVNLAFGIMLGALGVAAALAFGLGSRDLAGREVERWLDGMRKND